ncbi:hypothetical protein [Nocardia wallacei]|uniref:hypothetical protein n=1 Tax=Nocardia wallacei TaxID=480035 RepID=UPI00245558E5|nr:hypothetical protein [Nocardia wallacei]
MQEILSSVATLLWPVLFLVALLMFRGPVGRVIRSAEHREFTLTVGGQEIGMKELSAQQDDMIADLQTQLSRLQQEVAALKAPRPWSPPTATDAWLPPAEPGYAMPGPFTDAQPAPGSPWAGDAGLPPGEPGDSSETSPAGTEFAPASDDPGSGASPEPGARPSGPQTPPPPSARPGPAPNAVLWVDDKPQNNALIVDRLERNGVRVDIARTTEEALTLLDRGRNYGVVVTDWGRTENGVRVSDAGRRLLEEVRERDTSAPLIIYTSAFGISAARRDSATEAGARLVTGSTTRLTGELAALGLLPG